MIIRKHGYVLDVDVEETLKYSKEHSLCDCNEDRNLYAQIAEKVPKLNEFLAELGLLIERPDETDAECGHHRPQENRRPLTGGLLDHIGVCNFFLFHGTYQLLEY